MKGIFWGIIVFCTHAVYGQIGSITKLDQLMNSRQYYKALRYIDSLSREKQDNSEYYYYLTKANEGLMRYNDAYRYATLWFCQDTLNRDARLAIARLSNLAGHKSEALQLYEQLAREDSLDFSVNYALGRLYQQANRWGSALEVYKRQLTVDSTNITLLTLMGDCFVDIKFFSPAMDYYGKAFYEDVLNASLAIKATNVVLSNKELVPYYNDFLNRMLDTAILQAPRSFPLRQTLGVLRYANKQYPESEEIFVRLLESGDSSRITQKYLGLTKFQQDNYKEALPFLVKAYSLYAGPSGEPTDIELAMKYGEVLCRTGSCVDALYIFEAVERAVQPDKKFLSLLEVMKGMSYTYIMRMDKAVEAYWKAYKLNPGNTSALANFAYANCIDLARKKEKDFDKGGVNEMDRKKVWFAQILFLQKVKEKLNTGVGTQHEHARQVLQKALDELFFKNETKLVVSDPDGKEYSYPVEVIRKLVRKGDK